MSSVKPPGGSTPDANQAEIGSQKCSGCERVRPITDFPFKKKGPSAHVTHTKTCENCVTRKQAWRKEKAEEADGKKAPLRANKHKVHPDALKELPLSSFLHFIEDKGMVCDIEALMSISDIEGDQRE